MKRRYSFTRSSLSLYSPRLRQWRATPLPGGPGISQADERFAAD